MPKILGTGLLVLLVAVQLGCDSQTSTVNATDSGGSGGPSTGAGTHPTVVSNTEGFSLAYLPNSSYTYYMHQNYKLTVFETGIDHATAVNFAANTINVTKTYTNGMAVRLNSTSNLPKQLTVDATYYVVNYTPGAPATIQLGTSAAPGVPIDLTPPEILAVPVAPSGLIAILAQTRDYTKDCVIPPNTTGVDLYCVLEAKEEDLWTRGVTLNFNVPETMCNYLVERPYFYWVAPGVDVGTPQFTLDYDGGVTKKYSITGSIPAGTAMTLSNGDLSYAVTCDADYSKTKDGPNCCKGKWSVEITDTSLAGPDNKTTVTGDFAGKVNNCLEGPAMTFNTLTTSGLPISKEFNTAGSGVNDKLEIKSPQSLNSFGKQMRANTYLANYMNLWDSTQNDYLDRKPSAVFDWADSDSHYYIFECMDRAFEVINRINVEIRSWDRHARWDTMKETVTANVLSSDVTLADSAPYSTLCPVSGANGLLGCLMDSIDKEGGIGGSYYIQDHVDWRTIYMYHAVEGTPTDTYPVTSLVNLETDLP